MSELYVDPPVDCEADASVRAGTGSQPWRAGARGPAGAGLGVPAPADPSRLGNRDSRGFAAGKDGKRKGTGPRSVMYRINCRRIVH